MYKFRNAGAAAADRTAEQEVRHFNLQLFAEDDSAGADEGGADQGQQEQQQAAERKYTDADVDRIVAKHIAAERKRAAKALEGEQQLSDIEKRERDVLRRELTVDAKEKLSADGFDTRLADLLDYSSAEAMQGSYTRVTGLVSEIAQGLADVIVEKERRAFGHTPKNYHEKNQGASDIAQAFGI